MDNPFIVVLITAPSQEIGEKIATLLIEKRLAACVNITGPVQSLYTWEGKINQDEERLLIVKTKADIFEDKFVAAVRSIHPYDVPEIIALPITMGSRHYLDWLDEEIRP
ncbi:MAG: divalent-cation tolerance protein CutA [Anaerolineales bacterium]|nr:divalent-cation tolerance protein CutA [Anaerolineales bacterium]